MSLNVVEEIKPQEFPELDLIAQSVLKIQAMNPDVTLIELCAQLKRGIYSVKKALRFYELVVNPQQEIPQTLKLEDVQAKCREALVSSFRGQFPFTIQNMVVRLDFSVLEARAAWDFFSQLNAGMPPENQGPRFNNASRLLAEYMCAHDLSQPPGIAEILSELDFDFDVAASIVPFINFWIQKPCVISFHSLSEDRVKKLDAMAVLVANKLKQVGDGAFDFLTFMGQLSMGIVDLKEAIAYYQMILGEGEIPLPTGGEQLDRSTKEVIMQLNPQQSINVEMVTDLGYSLL